jgi:hypothetical protein
MKVATVLADSTAVAAAANADSSFSEQDQAIWIDRFNYFRTTGVPWSASNMRRIGWDAELANKAASTAAKCSAATSSGVSAYQASSANATDIIDEAIQQWVVETAVQTLKTVPQPGSDGLDVGVGIYNSYSQVLWASTHSVGCATASCSKGEMVVCDFSPAGNDGKSAWYKHGGQASECPEGTIASGGLCIEDGNDANDEIAPIAAGDWTYQVYPSFVADIHSILVESAREIAKGSIIVNGTTLSSNASSTPAPQATTSVSSAAKEAATKPPSSNSHEGTSTKQESSKPTKSSSSSSSAAPAAQDEGPGTVKASSDSGSAFQNEVQTAAPEATTPTTKQNTESLTTTAGAGEAANHGVSTLGMVSMFILGIAAVAGIVMFVHYRSSTKRQKDILLDGGIPA